jgi:hypothetical protein
MKNLAVAKLAVIATLMGVSLTPRVSAAHNTTSV